MDHKKPDLREAKVAPTDNNTVMPGSVERPDNIQAPHSDMHATSPEIGKNLAEGQVTKSN